MIKEMIAAALAIMVLLGGCRKGSEEVLSRGEDKEYGVFIGVDAENRKLLEGYEMVVIDGAYYTLEEIGEMKGKGRKVYSYLNIGSLESFRNYGKEFEEITLGDYENWPDELWMDVGEPLWQEYVTGRLAEDLVKKGVDGFFLDNADVYYVYPKEEIYQGLLKIVEGLTKYERPMIINGGDVWLKEAMLREDLGKDWISAVNQECVFTRIDFDEEVFGLQEAGTMEYYQEYLSLCREKGLKVYLTEYCKVSDWKLKKRIRDYCGKRGYLVYFSSSLELLEE